MKLDAYQEFVAAHRRFLLYSSGEPRWEWIEGRLRSEGWHLSQLLPARQRRNRPTNGIQRTIGCVEISRDRSGGGDTDASGWPLRLKIWVCSASRWVFISG